MSEVEPDLDEEREEVVSEEVLAEQENAMRAFLSKADHEGASRVAAAPDLLHAVQRKIRRRSKGKFFSDGWSTSQARVNYALVAMVMLVVIAVAYFSLGPTAFSR